MSYIINGIQVSRQLRIRPEVYKRIVISFTETLTGKMEILDEALRADNRDQMRKILHEIRGTAGNLRLSEIAESIKQMHEAIKDEEPREKLVRYLEILKSELKKLKQGIKDMAVELPS